MKRTMVVIHNQHVALVVYQTRVLVDLEKFTPVAERKQIPGVESV